MKSYQIFSALVTWAWLFGMEGTARALDASQTISLERYTIIDADNLQQDEGHLLRNGKFEVLTSFVGGYEDFSEDIFEPISGRPVLNEEEFDDLKTAGVIPHWTRSQADFYIGLVPVVIVSVVGGPDPNPAITIATQPSNQTVLVGQQAFFFVEASPAAYLSYQWLFNGKAMPGQTDAFLEFDVTKTSQAGNYSLELNTGGKSVMSKKAGLKVVLPVSITTPPKSQTVKPEHGAVFRVAAKGTGPYAYQWYFNDAPISSAIKSFYSIPHASQSDAGSYFVTVSNQLSFANSSTAILTVNP
jgi:hypothetical protein